MLFVQTLRAYYRRRRFSYLADANFPVIVKFFRCSELEITHLWCPESEMWVMFNPLKEEASPKAEAM